MNEKSIIIDHTIKALDYGNGIIVEACDHILEREGRLTMSSQFIQIGSNRKIVLCSSCVARFESMLLKDILREASKQVLQENKKAGVYT